MAIENFYFCNVYQCCQSIKRLREKAALKNIYHIFEFLKNNPKLVLYFDTQEPNIDPSCFDGDTV